ncbi:hypothetical protein PG990_007963 [Apiospora arundinis]
MPLNVVVVGAGIAGLAAATSLRQAGHRAVILEKHGVSNVVGAAINVTPTAAASSRASASTRCGPGSAPNTMSTSWTVRICAN